MKETMLSTVSSGPVLGSSSASSLPGRGGVDTSVDGTTVLLSSVAPIRWGKVVPCEGNDAVDRFFRSGAWVLFCVLLPGRGGASIPRSTARPFFYSSVTPIRWGKVVPCEGNDAVDRFFRSGAWVLFCVLLAGTRSRRYLGRRHDRSFIRPSLRYAAAKGRSRVKGNGARHRLPGPVLRSAPAFASPKTAPVVVDFAK